MTKKNFPGYHKVDLVDLHAQENNGSEWRIYKKYVPYSARPWVRSLRNNFIGASALYCAHFGIDFWLDRDPEFHITGYFSVLLYILFRIGMKISCSGTVLPNFEDQKYLQQNFCKALLDGKEVDYEVICGHKRIVKSITKKEPKVFQNALDGNFPPVTTEWIIEYHLKRNPGDAELVTKAFGEDTIPKGVMKIITKANNKMLKLK